MRLLARALLLAAAGCGLGFATGCAGSGPSSAEDAYYQSGTIHSDTYPETYRRAYPVGRPGRYGYRRRY